MTELFKYLFIGNLIICLSCVETNKRLEYALLQAGDNQRELEKVIAYYQNDSLKKKAAIYLIENMPFHFTKEQYFISPSKQTYIPDITMFTDRYAVKRHCDSIQKNGFRLIDKNKKDITTVKSDYLIENIELAFRVREKPWIKDLPFNDFCRYILPYRAQIEHPTSLRKELMERYLPLLDSLQPQNALEACIAVHQKLKDKIRYQTTGSPIYPTTEETYHTGFGDCNGLCNLTIAVMRSVGIPVTIDHTLWTKMNLGHNWCAVLSDSKFYGFNPGETDPGAYAKLLNNTYNRIPAKVYRCQFDPIFSNINKNMKDDGYKTSLKNVLNYDVTDEYLGKVINVVNPIEKNYENLSTFVYLCTFNCNQWQPLAIGEKREKHYIFENIVGDNIFIIADSPDGNSLRFVSAPFYVDIDGNLTKLFPDNKNCIDYAFSIEDFQLFGKYTLYYWDTEICTFVPLNLRTKNNKVWEFESIPQNALLLFYVPGANRNRNGFYFEQNKIQPWREKIRENC